MIFFKRLSSSSSLLNANTNSLSFQQQRVLDLMAQGHSMFLSGKAGSGKTYSLSKYLLTCQNVIPLAPTGIAASHIAGQTIHSFLKISNNDHDFSLIISRLQVLKSRVNSIKNAHVLVIDECSMVHPNIFSTLSRVFQHFRNSKLEFGGIQVIIVGDFFQLPPISTNRTNLDRQAQAESTQYIFETPTWIRLLKSGMHLIHLDQVFRQTDVSFIKMLNEFRIGECSNTSISILEECKNRVYRDDILPTKLCVYRESANRENQIQLTKLNNHINSFFSLDQIEYRVLPPSIWHTPTRAELSQFESTGSFKTRNIPQDLSIEFDKFQFDKCLNLSIGAQVILLKNVDVGHGLVNGSRGFVVGFEERFDQLFQKNILLPIVRFNGIGMHNCGQELVVGNTVTEVKLDDGIVLYRYQIPLKLGWAITIHKSQGMSLDRVQVDIPVSFTAGQVYVAFSRARDLNGLTVKSFRKESVYCAQKVKHFYSTFGTDLKIDLKGKGKKKTGK